MKNNAVYGQSGGVTSVINASAFGAIQACLNHTAINRVFASMNGIEGILNDNLVDMNLETSIEIEKIAYTPGAVFGSCRMKLKKESELEKIFALFDRYDVGYFFYNGGNDSMETIYQIAEYAEKIGYPLKAVGIPKTVDNDLEFTDHCPGYGSAAKFTAISLLEATKDVKSMSASSTKVFIMESMGRHAGWLAASGGLASLNGEYGPGIILFPELPFEEGRFLAKLEEQLNRKGYCSIIASEALRDVNGNYISASEFKDSFGNIQLGKISNFLENLITRELKVKTHTGLPDYLQRSSRHISSFTDWKEAIEVGATAVHYAADKFLGNVMVGIIRDMNKPYLKHYEPFDLKGIAAHTKYLPGSYISEDGFNVSDQFLKYAAPLIEGEAPNHFIRGIPVYAELKYKKAFPDVK